MKTCNISKNIQHMKTIQWVVLVHNTRFNDSRSNDDDSCQNYAKTLILYGDNSCITGSKNVSVICKTLVSWVKKTSLDILKIAVFCHNIF